MRPVAWVMSGCVLLVAGCGVRRVPPPPVRGPFPGTVQTGIASWYGPGFYGNRTSSGEIYDERDLTAAHRTLPLGTRAAVTNLENGRTVEVRINDRGPFVDGRILDLSYAAARSLGMIEPGTVPVRIEVLQSPSGALRAAYAVQVGAFADPANALELQRWLRRRFPNVYTTSFQAGDRQYYRVRIGRYGRREAAESQARAVAALGLPVIVVEDEGGD